MQASVSNNTTLKVNGAIASSTTSTGVKYTAPSNGYGVVRIAYTAGSASSLIIQVGGSDYFNANTTSATVVVVSQLYVGPSQTINVTTNAGSATVNITGVDFINSP